MYLSNETWKLIDRISSICRKRIRYADRVNDTVRLVELNGRWQLVDPPVFVIHLSKFGYDDWASPIEDAVQRWAMWRLDRQKRLRKKARRRFNFLRYLRFSISLDDGRITPFTFKYTVK